MINYIRADLYRILHRVPRGIVLLICFVGLWVGSFWFTSMREMNSVGLVSVCGFTFLVAAVLFGLVEIVSVFSADFKAKTMQIAIGTGVARRHIVLAKLLEFVILVLADNIVLMLGTVVGSHITGIPLRGSEIYQELITALGYMLYMLIPAVYTMIPMFFTQHTGLATILYLVLFADPASLIIEQFFSTNKIVLALHLKELTFSSMVGVFNTQLGLQISFPIVVILGIAAYIVIGYLLAVRVFRKRELEF